MKRFTLAAATALMLAGPLATTAAAQTYGQGEWRGDDNDRRGDRNDDRGDRGRDDNDWNRGDRGDRNDDRADRGRDDNDDWNRGERRGERRDHRRHRWDSQRHNGYSYNGRWYYGPAPAQYRDYADYGYRNWRRGDRLPSYYQTRYRTVDYRREHLRAPPRGYRYVEDDRGDMLLVGIATGVILSIILSQ